MHAEKALFLALTVFSLLFLAWMALPAKDEGRTVFFAYGANLDPATMRARSGGFEFAGAATLRGYRLLFRTGRQSEFGVADIVPDPNGSVSGAVYFLSNEQMGKLDGAAGVPGFYERKQVAVDFAGEEIGATTYALSGRLHRQTPSGIYLDSIRRGFSFYYGNQSFSEIDAALAESTAMDAAQSR